MNTQPAPRSGFAPFVPRARLLRLIGAELISDDVVAITELVKNAHDADASFVSIQFTNVTSPDGEITIRDDGHGMDLDTLLTRWMQPAGSSKERANTRFTAAGRRVLGEKGVGRFAADKLAGGLELVSRCRGTSDEVHAVFDWDEFDADDRMLSDVRSRWEVRPADWLDSHGTMLQLRRLRNVWTERMFRRLCTRLARLISPFDAGKGVRILIESDEFPQYSGAVGGGYAEVAPYRIDAAFDGDAAVTIRINDRKPSRHVLLEHERATCGPVRARLFAFDLETESLARLGPRAEVRAWLREWSGVSVYRDGFRVWPYGEPTDDWLRLDSRRVNNPVVRLSNNQVVGFVEISSDSNPGLRDQTNREGLIHNQEFEDLRRLVLHVLELIEAERQTLRHPQSKRHVAAEPRAGGRKDSARLSDHLDQLARRASGPLAEEVRKAADRARSAAEAESVARKRLLEGYTELAAIGQSAWLAARGAAASLEAIQRACTEIHGALGRGANFDRANAERALKELEVAGRRAATQLQAVTTPPAGAARRRRGLDVPAELSKFADLASSFLEQQNVTFEVVAPEGSVLRTEMRPEPFAAVFSALVSNSIDWSTPGRANQVTATCRLDGDFVEVSYQDTGRGVTAGLEDKIFEPMVTGRDAAGMGLTVARTIIESHGGSIELLTDRRRRGATFRIRLPRKKARATTPASASRSP